MKTRHMNIIKDLPISELTDEEIVKATMKRLGARSAMLVYEDTEGQVYLLGRYRKGGSSFQTRLIHYYEQCFGVKVKRMKQEEE